MDFPITELLPATRLFLAVLLHFVWQATIAAALVAIGRSLIHPKFCRVRYILSVVGLVAVLLFPLLTFGYYALNTAATQALFSISAYPASATHADASTPSLFGQFESQFQVVFAWFDNLRFFWLGGWLIGFVLFVLRLSVSLGHCLRLRRSQKSLPPRLRELADQLKSKLGLTQTVIIGVSQEITQAVAIGIIRPVVLIPAAWITQMPISAIEAVLAHELAHVKRWDLWINFLQRFVETVFFFHPLVWWLSKKISNEREVCCDQLAVRITGQPMRYVETLAYVAGNNDLDEFEFQFGTAFSGGKNMNLLRRAKLILEPASINAHVPFRTLALIAAVGLLVSYGSFAYSAAITAAMSELQDEDHDHEHQAKHDREHDDGPVAEVRRIRRDGRQDKKQNVFVREAQRSHDGDDERELRSHLAELLHRNELGTVSHQELAKKLRQLADHLESSNNTVRSAENVRRNFEVRERQIDSKQVQDKVQSRRFKVDPRRDKPVIIDREHFDRQEKEVELDATRDFRFRSNDDGDPRVVRRENQKPNENAWFRKIEVDREHDLTEVREKDLPFGRATTTSGELGQVLRELKSEVQQLRREVNRLKSERTSTPPEESRGTLRRRFGSDRDTFREQADIEKRETDLEEVYEYRVQSSKNRESANKPQGWVESPTKRDNIWVESPTKKRNNKQMVEIGFDEQDPASEVRADEAEPIVDKPKKRIRKKN